MDRPGITTVKVVLLGIYLATSNLGLVERITGIGLQPALLVFVFIWIAAVITLILLAFQPLSITKLVLSLLFILAAAISTGYYLVTHQYMEFHQFETLLNAAENLSDALSAFHTLGWAIAIAVLGLTALLLPGGPKVPYGRAITLVTSLFLTLLMVGILYLRHGEGTRGMPSQYTPLAYGLILGVEQLTSPAYPKHRSVNIEPHADQETYDLVLIMDESIRGDYLDINSTVGINSGLLPFQDDLINFGVASSMANCSDSNNVSMRFGVSRAHYLEDLRSRPSIWQFASKAGFSTTYIDAQNTGGRLGNHMDQDERTFIDNFEQIEPTTKPLYEKDLSVAKLIRKRLQNSNRDFIYVNKMGVHFPYEGKYPRTQSPYQPTMAASSFDKSFPKEGEVKWPSSNDALTRLKFVNSYRNAVHWNLSTFFNALLLPPIKKPYLLIYTSDHGQTFHDDGRKGYGTHCSIVNTDPEEGRVPFIIFTNNRALRLRFKRAARKNYGKVSQFNVPDTLYQLMGYRAQDLTGFEKSIFQPLEKKQQLFLSKFFVRFGEKPIWNSIYSKTTITPAGDAIKHQLKPVSNKKRPSIPGL